MIIRQEEPKDYKAIFKLVEEAFKDEPHSDHTEQFLVERLRQSSSYVPQLALVAEVNKEIVGFILLTKIKIVTPSSETITSLALAPVAVLKNYQGKGIGSRLIQEAHQKAKALNFGSIVLLGHQDYYPRFGYTMAKHFNIRLPFEVPEENCMVIELQKNALKDVDGVVAYPKEFFE